MAVVFASFRTSLDQLFDRPYEVLVNVAPADLFKGARFARVTRERSRRCANLVVAPASRHSIPHDPADSPALRAALAAGVDFLVANDVPLLNLNPYESLRIISMTEYFDMLVAEGHIVV
jgi:predicted nucleic acid-binding protein